MDETDTTSVGETIAEELSSAIDTAIESREEQKEQSQEIIDALVNASMDEKQAQRLNEFEERVYQWQNQNNELTAQLSEAVAGLVMGLTSVTAKVDLLTQQQFPMQSHQNAVDGLKENPEPEVEIKVETPEQVEQVETPPEPVKKKKRHRWI